jgi:hypothetical protein
VKIFSPEESRLRKRISDHRRWKIRRQRRHEGYIAKLTDQPGAYERLLELSGEDLIKILFDHGHRSKRVIRHAGWKAGAGQPSKVNAKIHRLPPPGRTILKSRRSNVRPQLLLSREPVEHITTLKEALKLTRELAQKASPPQVLDFFVRASGTNWESGAQILRAKEILPMSFSDAEVADTQAAALFWERYNNGRKVYHGAMSLGDLPQFDGDIAVFDAAAFKKLLPTLRVPKHPARRAYLTRLRLEGKQMFLDVYSADRSGRSARETPLARLPLFRQPFSPVD